MRMVERFRDQLNRANLRTHGGVKGVREHSGGEPGGPFGSESGNQSRLDLSRLRRLGEQKHARGNGARLFCAPLRCH